MKQRIFTFILFLFLLSQSLISQCLIEQLDFNGNNGPNLGSSLGQQIVPCETGLIEEIEINLNPGSQTSTMKIEIYESATDWQNLIWTVDNIAISGGGFYTIDMASGFGTSQELTEGVTYSIRFWNTGTGFFFFWNKFGATDAYPDGFTLNHFGDVVNWAPNFNDRYFRIAFNGGALPVELTSFKAEAIESETQVNLFWETASELNNAGFEIQRSSNAREWETIGFVEGKGSTNQSQEYDFKDRQPLAGINYYRLKQMDYDGAFEYSNIDQVTFNYNPSKLINIYPNPNNGHFNINVYNPNKQTAILKLFDSTGKIIWEQRFPDGDMPSVWNHTFDLPQYEVYFFTTQIGDQIASDKIVIIDKF